MSGFILADEIDVLNYDFAPYVPEAKGIIPEPSSAQIKAFRKGMLEAFAPVVDAADAMPSGNDDASRIEMLKAALLANSNPESEKIADDAMAAYMHACADVCGGTPSFEQIDALPDRPKRAFAGWLVGTFLKGEE